MHFSVELLVAAMTAATPLPQSPDQAWIPVAWSTDGGTTVYVEQATMLHQDDGLVVYTMLIEYNNKSDAREYEVVEKSDNCKLKETNWSARYIYFKNGKQESVDGPMKWLPIPSGSVSELIQKYVCNH